jgi:hypothetical protein
MVDRLRAGAVSGCGRFVPPLTEEDIEASPRVVAQLGPEPFLDAMVANPDFDIIVGGRAYDPSPYVAYAAFLSRARLGQADREETQRLFGGFTHMGKIMECGGLVSSFQIYRLSFLVHFCSPHCLSRTRNSRDAAAAPEHSYDSFLSRAAIANRR